MLVCPVCYSKYYKHSLKPFIFNNDFLYTCPNAECVEQDLIELDDHFVDIIPKLWEVGINTRYSCNGHLYEGEQFSPYIVFITETKEEASEFINFMSLSIGKFRRLNIEDLQELSCDSDINKVDNIETESGIYHKFILKGTPFEDSVKDKLETQYELISFLYEFYSNLLKEAQDYKELDACEKIENDASK